MPSAATSAAPAQPTRAPSTTSSASTPLPSTPGWDATPCCPFSSAATAPASSFAAARTLARPIPGPARSGGRPLWQHVALAVRERWNAAGTLHAGDGRHSPAGVGSRRGNWSATFPFWCRCIGAQRRRSRRDPARRPRFAGAADYSSTPRAASSTPPIRGRRARSLRDEINRERIRRGGGAELQGRRFFAGVGEVPGVVRHIDTTICAKSDTFVLQQGPLQRGLLTTLGCCCRAG